MAGKVLLVRLLAGVPVAVFVFMQLGINVLIATSISLPAHSLKTCFPGC